jgi:aryl-alcohol dehydrogenase-like predicted oxidoreductase
MAFPGRATPAGTARFSQRPVGGEAPTASRARGQADGRFNALGDLWVSSVGLGLAPGEPTAEVDASYIGAISAALQCGCNHFDAALSYRGQRSERALGAALAQCFAAGVVQRDEVFVCSKAGFIPYEADASDPARFVYENFIAAGIAEPDDIAGGIHCMTPNFLSQQLAWSLRNTGLRSLDLYYIQNPETQLPFVDRTTFRRRLQLAFARLEDEVAAGRIGYYGIATWEGLRLAPLDKSYMSLEVLQRLVAEVAGKNHHLRVIQLPVNAAMLEAFTFRNQPVRNSLLPAVSAARDLGFQVVASAALGQGQFPPRMREALAETFPAFGTDRQRGLQMIRSLPGITSALFGSTEAAHVREDLMALGQPADPAAALRVAHLKGR